MVKLRLPRSPFLGVESSSSANNTTTTGGTRRSRRIQNRRMQPQQQQQQQQQQLGMAAMESADETERRPDNHDNNNENNVDSLEQQSGRSSLRRMFASPGKRKPESRGITASIRRARTATSQTATATGAAAVASSQLRLDMDEEDAVGGDVLRERNNTEDTILSQEENKNGVPPLSLLSPNSGTFYAHAAANDAMDIDDNATAGGGQIMTRNVLQWMKDDAPPELLPRILSFCGSRRLSALSKVNRKWNSIINDESIWRVMCEDTHKVSEILE